MTLQAGQHLSGYEILGPLGAGGMGEVYRARDPKLGREVAIKVLPEAVEQDPERLARFEREARVLAQLNHPNIATLHGFFADDGVHFLVMELVPGETLADRIARDPLPLDEALPLFLQIAEGLEAAHEQGIVHRDLKPANIKLAPGTSGAPERAKILDFGLAKALVPESLSGTGARGTAAESPTLTLQATLRGEILGTAAYMSPEQARGKQIDRRTDVWAFGACLYEALCGRRAFEGETPTDIIAQVVTRDPDWDALPAATPGRIRRLLRRCLERDPRHRLRDVGDAWVELDEVRRQPDEGGAAGATSDASPPPSRRHLAWVALAAAIPALVLGLVLGGVRGRAEPADGTGALRRYEINLGTTAPIPVYELPTQLALSPDASILAVALSRSGDSTDLFVRRLDGTELEPVEGADWAYTPFFSPDGRWIGFYQPQVRILAKIPVAGGPATEITKAFPPTGATWLPDDRIVFTREITPNRPALFAVSSEGGEATQLTHPDAGLADLYPYSLPGGHALVYSRANIAGTQTDMGARSSLWTLDLETGDERLLLDEATGGIWVATGHLLFYRNGAIWALPFDAERLQATGRELELFRDVLANNRASTTLTAAPAGPLVYTPLGGSRQGTWVVDWFDENGNRSPFISEPGQYLDMRLAPDGKRAAVLLRRPGQSSLWIHDTGGRPPIRLDLTGTIFNPVWRPDGSALAVNYGAEGRLYEVAADLAGGEPRELVLPEELRGAGASSWAPDGRELVIEARRERDSDLWAYELDGGATRPLAVDASFAFDGRVSPDGRWLAFTGNNTGTFEIYVTRYDGSGTTRRVSADVGLRPVWSADGSRLYYLSGRRVMSAERTDDDEFPLADPVLLFETEQPLRQFNAAPDGRLLAVARAEGADSETRLVVVEGLLQELRKRTPGGA